MKLKARHLLTCFCYTQLMTWIVGPSQHKNITSGNVGVCSRTSRLTPMPKQMNTVGSSYRVKGCGGGGAEMIVPLHRLRTLRIREAMPSMPPTSS
jgi:hypothetical protein